jgi:hypothetical protein
MTSDKATKLIKTYKVITMVCLLIIGIFSLPDFMYWLSSMLGFIGISFFIMNYAKYGTFDIFYIDRREKDEL